MMYHGKESRQGRLPADRKFGLDRTRSKNQDPQTHEGAPQQKPRTAGLTHNTHTRAKNQRWSDPQHTPAREAPYVITDAVKDDARGFVLANTLRVHVQLQLFEQK